MTGGIREHSFSPLGGMRDAAAGHRSSYSPTEKVFPKPHIGREAVITESMEVHSDKLGLVGPDLSQACRHLAIVNQMGE